MKILNINKDGKTLYFSDEEIDNTQDGEKKVFVTKRINGKESHVKAERTKRNVGKHHYTEQNQNNEIFNFNDEIVIGVNKAEEDDGKRKKNKKGKKNKKKNIFKRNKKESKLNINKQKENKKKERKLNAKKLNENKLNKDKKVKRKSKAKKKKIKTIKNKKPIIVATTIILLIIAIVIFALTAPIFNIKQISIEGNEAAPAETIINLSGIKKGENIFKFNKSAITKIKENKYIQDVNIKRKLPGTVIISVKERTVKYQLNLINSYVYIDKSGNILEITETKANVPVITGLNITEDKMMNSSSLEENDLKELNKIAKIMESSKAIEIENLITEINIEDKNNFILYLENENKKIYIGDTLNLTNKMLYIKKMLENEKSKSGIIFVNGDISTGFKPYFREE